VSFDGSRNYPAATTPVRVFVCPADPGRPPGLAYAGTGYAANAGSGANAGSLTNADGVFFLGSVVRFEDVTDGTSNTAAFSERLMGDGTTDPRRVMLELPGNPDPTPAACAPSSGSWNGERGGKWIVGNYGNTLYNHALPPNPPVFDCLNMTQQKARTTARSLHPGGVNLLACDGSVRFVRDAIAPPAWQALATRAGGEPTVSD
jgi:prepilin-type processing-associated H-X9-DG protein